MQDKDNNKNEKLSIKDAIASLQKQVESYTIMLYKAQGALEALNQLKDEE